jgi:hypothetical protein
MPAQGAQSQFTQFPQVPALACVLDVLEDLAEVISHYIAVVCEFIWFRLFFLAE